MSTTTILPQPDCREIDWIDMADRQFWARVYEVKAQSNCTLEQAIKAIHAADLEEARHEYC